MSSRDGVAGSGTAAITSVDSLPRLLTKRVVGIGMAYAVWARALHDSPVVAPVLRPGPHVMIRAAMKRTGEAVLQMPIHPTDFRLVGHDGAGGVFERLFGVVGFDTPPTGVADVETILHSPGVAVGGMGVNSPGWRAPSR